MVIRILAGLATGLILVLASCSENGLLTPLSSQSNQIAIKSVANGTMVSNGEQIPLSVNMSSSQTSGTNPTDLKVDLLSSSGEVVQSADIKNVDFSAPLPSVVLSDLRTGTYTMRLTLENANQDVLAQQKVKIFYVQGTYSLDGISSYPPTLTPGGSGLIVARVTVPKGSNPYFRWSMGDKLIASGYLDKGYDQIPWNAPTSTGVYSITVEMFPYGPPTGDTFDFTSPYKMKVEVFVSSSVKAGKNELGPKDSYYALYHFQGNLKDAVARAQGLEAIPVGNPTLSVSGSIFGYQLDGSSGFKVNSLLLPFDAQGNLLPSSITMRIRLDKVEPNREYFRTSTVDQSFVLDMGTNSNGLLSVAVNGVSEANGGVTLKSGDISSVTLSLIPANGQLDLLWFVNGQLELSDTLAAEPKITPGAQGQSVIGGSNGFTGLIDELGVYYKDSKGQHSTDPEVYRRAMVEEYGSNLVFAEGFDGIYLPSDLTYTGKVSTNQLAAGMLSLNSQQSVTLPSISLGEDELGLTMTVPTLPTGAQGELTLTAKGKQLYSVALSGALVQTNSDQVGIKVLRVDGGIEVSVGDTSPTTIEGTFSHFDFGITNSGTVPFNLRSFLVLRSRAQLSGNGTSGSQSSTAGT